MLESVAQEIVELLCSQGISAGRAFPSRPLPEGGVFVRVGIASAAQEEAGFARFLGMRTDGDDMSPTEVYGMLLRMELRIDIYAGMEHENAACVCEGTMDRILPVLASHSGLKPSCISCGEALPDRDSGMFRCRAAAVVRAELCFEKSEDSGEFTDFILKGELKNDK